MITEPEYLDELEKLEEGQKNKAPYVAAKSRKRSKTQNKSTKRKNQKEDDNLLYHLQKNVKHLSDETLVVSKV